MRYFWIQQAKQEQQKNTHDTTAHNRSLLVITKFCCGRTVDIPGHIIELVGSVSSMIELEDGRIFKQHQDHIRNRLTSKELIDILNNSSDFMDFPCPAAESAVFIKHTTSSASLA